MIGERIEPLSYFEWCDVKIMSGAATAPGGDTGHSPDVEKDRDK